MNEGQYTEWKPSWRDEYLNQYNKGQYYQCSGNTKQTGAVLERFVCFLTTPGE